MTFFPSNAVLNDSVDLDDVSLLKFANYVADPLEIFVVKPTWTTTAEAVNSDFYNRVNSRTDHTNVLVAYDI